MCGICGYITKEPSEHLARAFKSLLIANEDRGTHSSGVYGFAKGKEFIHKDKVSGSELVKELNGELNTASLVLGHTRFATIGAINKENAHPYKYDGIVGVHNGHVTNYKELYEDADVDSQAIFYLLNKEENNFKSVFSKITGDVASAWTDNSGKLYLVRHDNPLHIALVGSTLYFNSESLPLKVVLNSIYDDVFETFELEENQVYVIDENLKMFMHKVEFKKRVFNTTYSHVHSGKKGKKKGKKDKTIIHDFDEVDDDTQAWLDSRSGGTEETDYKGIDEYDIFMDISNEQGCIVCGCLAKTGMLDTDHFEIYCLDHMRASPDGCIWVG